MQEQPVHSIEQHTIQQIPLNERHGRPLDLFTLWFGGNLMLLTFVTGSLSVIIFQQSFISAILSTILGTLIGAIFAALHAAQGPQLGVPQMIQTKGQFGSLGALPILGIVVIMYVGFLASNITLAGQAINLLIPSFSQSFGIILAGIVAVTGAIVGYRLIHLFTKIIFVICGIGFVLAYIWVFIIYGLPLDFFERNSFSATGFLASLSIAALWQIAYAPYVSDASRYLPKETGARSAFWATYWGCSLGTIIPMSLGITIGLLTSNGDVISGLINYVPELGSGIIFILVIAIAAINSMNLYCGVLTLISFIQTLIPSFIPSAKGRVLISFVFIGIALWIGIKASSNFLPMFTNFIFLLIYVLIPWTAVNLVDYYWVRHGEYDVKSFFLQDGGKYGKFNILAVSAYIFGVVVQIPFIATELYTGSIAHVLNGADISWVVGLILTSIFYLVAIKLYGVQEYPSKSKN
ncbi:cytosine permease [Acinetobacter bereziniae]|uniref:purine-cytosine permease family protein n=1 Tax=Acinetobacter bereziniae TaxID=106648 RepID=UPI0021CD333C|nr:cytosine permease [Acinetobacter bereziniae]MCU4539521.1 cytosine permease [Acinetobacter bereziniae]